MERDSCTQLQTIQTQSQAEVYVQPPVMCGPATLQHQTPADKQGIGLSVYRRRHATSKRRCTYTQGGRNVAPDPGFLMLVGQD